jgi:hypothetical protein
VRKNATKLVAVSASLVIGAILAVAIPALGRGNTDAGGLASSQLRFKSLPSTDVFPAAVARALDYLPDPRMGSAIGGEVRQLFADAGRNRVSLYAFPTTNGYVCYVLTESASPGSCVGRFARNQPIAWSVYSGETVSPSIAGLVSDEVVSVEVVVKGTERSALLAHGAFFYQPRDATAIADFDGLRVTLKDGTSVVKSLSFLR